MSDVPTDARQRIEDLEAYAFANRRDSYAVKVLSKLIARHRREWNIPYEEVKQNYALYARPTPPRPYDPKGPAQSHV